jgi:hypothetical protein
MPKVAEEHSLLRRGHCHLAHHRLLLVGPFGDMRHHPLRVQDARLVHYVPGLDAGGFLDKFHGGGLKGCHVASGDVSGVLGVV